MDRLLASVCSDTCSRLKQEASVKSEELSQDGMSKMAPPDITIAITVYDRREYLPTAIRSALTQTTAVQPRVMVVEDCGPGLGLQEAIKSEFGQTIQYIRNPKRRGLCDNWNACIEACTTQWLCILHDDDVLEPTFVDAMLELSQAAPGRALYYGLCDVIDGGGDHLTRHPRSLPFGWQQLAMENWAIHDPVCFPGQLFNAPMAASLGGFRAMSRYTADWEMWFKLALNHGAAGTNRVVARYRDHHSVGRGTTDADLSGRRYAYVNIQRKRHTAWLRNAGMNAQFDRISIQRGSPMPSIFLLSYGNRFPLRMLRYNAGLMFLSSSPHGRYRLFQLITKLLTWRSLRITSRLFQLFSR